VDIWLVRSCSVGYTCEFYVALPMRHETAKRVDSNLTVEYSGRRGRKWESLKMRAMGEPQTIPAGSHAEFITEHYWGYTSLRNGCGEYRVRTSPMENLEWERVRIGRRRCNSLWQAMRWDIEAITPLRIYCWRLTDYRSQAWSPAV